ncbi:MAG: histidine phosphatase family protein, partial [Deltaproteobacteria bacterium]|nr:histidine phosphatase family protein [Deltaproteobacteria bacterium]
MKRRNRFYIIRHGQVAGYDRFPVYGHTDVELTEIGFLQMKEAAERLRLLKIHAVYSSDLKRSM